MTSYLRRRGGFQAGRSRAGLARGCALAWIAERARGVVQWLLLMALIATLAWLAMRLLMGAVPPGVLPIGGDGLLVADDRLALVADPAAPRFPVDAEVSHYRVALRRLQVPAHLAAEGTPASGGGLERRQSTLDGVDPARRLPHALPLGPTVEGVEDVLENAQC